MIRAIRHSKVGIYKDKLEIDDEIQSITEYHRYKPNMLIIIDENDKQYYQLIIDSKVAESTDNIDSQIIDDFFKLDDIIVLDNTARQLKIVNTNQLYEFISKTNAIRNVFDSKKNLYHRYMDKLYDYRKIRANMLNDYAGYNFNRLIKVADTYASELRDLCTDTLFSDQEYINNKYYIKAKKKINNINLFGLYLAVLKAYKQSAINEPTDYFSLDYIIYLNFLKEFNAFISKNKFIVNEYFEYYNLRPTEQHAINDLLATEHLNGKAWLYGSSELSI